MAFQESILNTTSVTGQFLLEVGQHLLQNSTNSTDEQATHEDNGFFTADTIAVISGTALMIAIGCTVSLLLCKNEQEQFNRYRKFSPESDNNIVEHEYHAMSQEII